MAKNNKGDGFSTDFSNDFFNEVLFDKEKSVKENVLSKESLVEERVQKEKSIKKEKEEKKPFSIYLLDEEDRFYLQFRSQSKHLTMTEFLWKLINDDIKETNKHKFDLSDELHSKFRSVNLHVNTCVKATKSEKDSIMIPSAMHRLKPTRYIAYVVYKARLSDENWQHNEF